MALYSEKTQTTAERIFEHELYPLVGSVYTFAYRLTNDVTKAQDLTQETYLKAWRFMDRYLEGTNAKAWLFHICRNAFINEYRSALREPRKVDYEDVVVSHNKDEPALATHYVDLQKEVSGNLMSDEVMRALNALSPELRLLVLLDLDGFTYEEITAIANIPIGTARSRLNQARNILAEKLRDYAKTQNDTGDKAPVPEETGLNHSSRSEAIEKIQTAIKNKTNSAKKMDELLDDDYQLVQYSRQGISGDDLLTIIQGCPFSTKDWSNFIQTDEPTFQAYLSFTEPVPSSHSERILEIYRLLRKGETIFGSPEDFYAWLNTKIPAMGNIEPKTLLNNTFGIQIIRDELTRIEHGVLA